MKKYASGVPDLVRAPIEARISCETTFLTLAEQDF